MVTSNGERRQATTNVRRLKVIACGPATGEDPAVRAAMSGTAERAAFLHWLTVGAALWSRDGCPVPATVRARAREIADDAPVVQFTAGFEPGQRYPSGDVGCAGKRSRSRTAAPDSLRTGPPWPRS